MIVNVSEKDVTVTLDRMALEHLRDNIVPSYLTNLRLDGTSVLCIMAVRVPMKDVFAPVTPGESIMEKVKA